MGSIHKVSRLELPGIRLIEVSSTGDERGSNTKVLSTDELKMEGVDFTPIELLRIHSNQNVLRGLHFQSVYGQSRMIACLKGELFVAAVDVNPERDIVGRSCTTVLKQPNQCLYIPAGYAVGTYALTDADFLCMCGEYPFMSSYASGIKWDDPDVDIKWPTKGENIILSEADRKLPALISAMKKQKKI